MTRTRLLSCVSLTAGLALLLVTHRTPAPHVPTLPEETTALRAEVARQQAQLRRQQAELDALSLRLSPALRLTKLPRRDRPRLTP